MPINTGLESSPTENLSPLSPLSPFFGENLNQVEIPHPQVNGDNSEKKSIIPFFGDSGDKVGDSGDNSQNSDCLPAEKIRVGDRVASSDPTVEAYHWEGRVVRITNFITSRITHLFGKGFQKFGKITASTASRKI
jgi:hypothetical protein